MGLIYFYNSVKEHFTAVSNDGWYWGPRGLRRRSSAARLLETQARIPLRIWMFVCCVCSVWCRQWSSAKSWSLVRMSPTVCVCVCVIVCVLETSTTRRRCATEKQWSIHLYNTYHTVSIALIPAYLKIKFVTVCNAHRAYFSEYNITISWNNILKPDSWLGYVMDWGAGKGGSVGHSEWCWKFSRHHDVDNGPGTPPGFLSNGYSIWRSRGHRRARR